VLRLIFISLFAFNFINHFDVTTKLIRHYWVSSATVVKRTRHDVTWF